MCACEVKKEPLLTLYAWMESINHIDAFASPWNKLKVKICAAVCSGNFLEQWHLGICFLALYLYFLMIFYKALMMLIVRAQLERQHKSRCYKSRLIHLFNNEVNTLHTHHNLLLSSSILSPFLSFSFCS